MALSCHLMGFSSTECRDSGLAYLAGEHPKAWDFISRTLEIKSDRDAWRRVTVLARTFP
jgi:hypothetical protein